MMGGGAVLSSLHLGMIYTYVLYGCFYVDLFLGIISKFNSETAIVVSVRARAVILRF